MVYNWLWFVFYDSPLVSLAQPTLYVPRVLLYFVEPVPYFVDNVSMFKVALNQLVEAIQLRCQHMFVLT